MGKKQGLGVFALALAALLTACGGGANTNNATNANASNANAANTNAANATGGALAPGQSAAAPDNSTVAVTEEGGARVETRTFTGGPVEKVVVTTRDGRRTARVFARSGEIRDLPESRVGEALTATADQIVSAAGFVSEAAEDVSGEIGDKAEDAGGAAVKGGREAADKAEDAAGKAVEGARAAGDKAEDVGGAAKSGAKKAASGAKKGAKAVKDVITP